MPYRSDRAVPHRKPRFLRRFWITLVTLLCLFVVGTSIAAYQLLTDDESTEIERVRAEVVMQYLAANHADAPWYGSILDVSIKDQKLYVRTDLARIAPFRSSESEVRRSTNATWARRMYEVLWEWHFVVPELEFFWVYIQDRDGNYIDGGQG